MKRESLALAVIGLISVVCPFRRKPKFHFFSPRSIPAAATCSWLTSTETASPTS